MPIINITLTKLVDHQDGTATIEWTRAGVDYTRRITLAKVDTRKKLAQWIVDQPIEGRAVLADMQGDYDIETDAEGRVIGATKRAAAAANAR